MVDLRLNDIQPEYEEASTNVDMGKIISAGCMNVEIPDLPDTRRQTAQLNQVEPAFALESPDEALEDPLETAARTEVVNAPPSTSEVDPEMEENHLIHEEERLVRRIGPERTASLTHYDPVRPEETRAEVTEDKISLDIMIPMSKNRISLLLSAEDERPEKVQGHGESEWGIARPAARSLMFTKLNPKKKLSLKCTKFRHRLNQHRVLLPEVLCEYGQLPFPPGMDPNQWGWNRPRVPGLRPGAFMQGPRRGPYMRPGFFPGPRGPPPQHHPGFNQRKPRPNWMPRLVRLPHSHFPSAPNDPNFNYPQSSNWTAPTPPPTPAPSGSGEEDSAQQGDLAHPPKKKKRSANGTARPWDRDAAEIALKTEMEFKKNAGAHALVVRFPDPELSKDIIQKYNSAIENVHFQGPCSPRYCFVTLREGANVDQVMTELNDVQFGNGMLKAERKVEKQEENVKPEDIDPFTLFIGNLPANISTVQVKEKFPTALRIDVGYAQKMKYTRYAFARYSTTTAALEAYKQSINTIIANRSIVLRFRRNNAPVGPPGEKPAGVAPAVEPKPGEKLTVGAKLKAKRDKAKQEKAQKDRELGRYTYDDDDDSDEDKVSLEDDDSDSTDMMNEGDEDIDDDEDDGEGEFEDDDDDDEEGEDEPLKKPELDDDDDDDDDVTDGNGDLGNGNDVSGDDDDDDEVMKDSDFFSRLGLRK
ncbi:hypothetical protein GE061_019497 [Apolygus lucorum]|uniref:Uncharacterized protein n=1 Tax=Apolygus lucorum TaxID=248454 RepID=A0A6A4JZN1_APOLU|nr:hypothetical protein GE061_019497 [Apolygus lucorum]